MIRLCILCLSLVAAVAPTKLAITDFAVPSSVKSGDNAELQCLYEGPPETGLFYFKWWWTPIHKGKDERKVIYLRLAGHAPSASHHLMNITIKENDTIEIANLQSKDSGIFECEVFDEGSESKVDEDHRQHELIVYSPGTGPELNVTEIPDGPDADSDNDVLIECQADDVAPEPDLVININGEEIVNRTTLMVKDQVSGQFDIYTNVTVSKEKVVGNEVRCELFYKNEDVSHEAYIASTTYQLEGGELISTETPEVLDTENITSTEPLQNDNNGSSVIGSCMTLLTAVLSTQLLFTLRPF